MPAVSPRDRRDDGSALLTALLATLIMLMLGLALLSTVDVQAQESGKERVRDQSFNLAEAALNNEAFILGRSWPGSAATAPTTAATCGAGAAWFGATVGAAPTAGSPAAPVQATLNQAYTDPAYTSATWRLTVCDDDPSSTVWNDALLSGANWDVNHNDQVWVRAEATVLGRTRVLVGLVRGLKTAALDPRYGAVAGSIGDDLGTTVDTLSNSGSNGGVLGGVLSGLINDQPTVAPDPSVPAATQKTGVTGVRCGLADLSGSAAGLALCTTGTIAGVGAGVPVVGSILGTYGVENFPSVIASNNAIAQLRDQAKASGTYTAVSAGTAPRAAGSVINASDRLPSGPIATCQITGSPDANSVAFIEQVGAGTPGTLGGAGDQYCSVDVSTAKTWKALVIGSGRVVLRGDNTTSASTNRAKNSFNGVVYALNLQRLTALGDDVSLMKPGRELVRLDQGAHVHGAVIADGRSSSIGIYPPPLNVDNTALVDSLVPCRGIVSCTLNATLKAVNGVVGLVNQLVDAVGLSAVVSGLNAQLNPQRENYGSAITSDVASVNAVKVLSASAIVPGTFRDLQVR
jgi:hypothetical protein